MLICFLVLWLSSKITTTSIMEFKYSLILSVISLELPTTSLCFSFESTHNYSKIYLANKNLKICQFLQLDATKKWNAATLSTLNFNTGFTSILCNWKKVQCLKLVEDHETVDIQIKFQRLVLFSWRLL